MAEKSALVVDDSRVARMTLTRLLHAYGFSVIEQDSAEDALKWLSGDIQLPNVIFMDVMMPGMDGISATREFKTRPLLKQIPIIVCTGNDGETDTDKARESGAMAVLAKPPAPAELFAILTQINQPQSATQSTQQPAAAAHYDVSLVNKVQARLEQHWLPEVLDKFQQTLDAGSQHFSAQKLQQIHAELMPALQDTLKSTVQDHFNHAFEMQQKQLQQAAERSLEQSLAQFNLQARLTEFESLKAQTEDWFLQQQRALEMQLQTRAETQLTPMIEQILEQQLRPKLLAMINAQLTEENAALYELRDLQLNQAHQVSRVQWLAAGSLAVALLVAIAVFVAG